MYHAQCVPFTRWLRYRAADDVANTTAHVSGAIAMAVEDAYVVATVVPMDTHTMPCAHDGGAQFVLGRI
jgi:hypothetical protein